MFIESIHVHTPNITPQGLFPVRNQAVNTLETTYWTAMSNGTGVTYNYNANAPPVVNDYHSCMEVWLVHGALQLLCNSSVLCTAWWCNMWCSLLVCTPVIVPTCGVPCSHPQIDGQVGRSIAGAPAVAVYLYAACTSTQLYTTVRMYNHHAYPFSYTVFLQWCTMGDDCPSLCI